MNIKKLWITQVGNCDSFTVSIRFSKPEEGLNVMTQSFPPVEPIDGKRLSIIEAIEQNKVESHMTLYGWTEEELFRLRQAIDQTLGLV